jgi:rubrerythrin
MSDNFFFWLRPDIGSDSFSDNHVRDLSAGIDRQRATITIMPAIQHSVTTPYNVKSRPTTQAYRRSNNQYHNDRSSGDTGQPRQRQGVGQPGTVYLCPVCEFATLDLRKVETHWKEIHADEHGPFCRADIEVIE